MFEWPWVGYLVTAATASAVLSIQLLDSLQLFGTRIETDGLRGRFIETARWAAVPLFALSAYTVAKYGWQGVYLALFGLIVSVIMTLNFRAGYIRPGTFDFFENSRWWWMGPILIGSLIGMTAGVVRSLKEDSRPTIRFPSVNWIWPILLVLAGARAAQELHAPGATSSLSSAFPGSRHYALFVLAASLATILLFAENWRIRCK